MSLIWKKPVGMEVPNYLEDEPNWNLWCGPNYKRGESPMITLRDTYGVSTYECWINNQRYRTNEHLPEEKYTTQDRENDKDTTFNILIDHYLTPGELDKIAITNFLEMIYKDRETRSPGFYPGHYVDSEPLFHERLLRHRPPVILVIMGVPEGPNGWDYNAWGVDVANKLEPRPHIIDGPHPLHAQMRAAKGAIRGRFRAAIQEFRERISA
jgi:hypothetical protein